MALHIEKSDALMDLDPRERQALAAGAADLRGKRRFNSSSDDPDAYARLSAHLKPAQSHVAPALRQPTQHMNDNAKGEMMRTA